MKFLAVCGFGVGSSMVLKMSLESVVSELGIDAEVENTDVSSAQGMTCDAIFTSPTLIDNLKETTNVPVYQIEKYMNKEEVKAAVEAFLAEK